MSDTTTDVDSRERRTAIEDAFWEPHASPRSVWTAVAAYPVLILALYRRSPRLFGATLVWFLANLRLASPPETDDAWATRVVRGEQVWLERGLGSRPGTLGLLGVGAAVHLWTFRAAARRRPGRTLVGTVVSMALMFGFFDRMVTLYERRRYSG